MKINWSAREVDVFLALADSLSFRRTALQMHLSQSAVSGTLARLEEMLGARLFERTTRAVELTQAGEVFAEQARFLRHQMEETVRRVQEVAQVQVGRLALAALPSLAAGLLPRVLARFAAEHPGVHLELFDSLAGPAFDMVRAGRVDFALTAANPAYADLDYLPLASDRFVLLLGRGHALARPADPRHTLCAPVRRGAPGHHRGHGGCRSGRERAAAAGRAGGAAAGGGGAPAGTAGAAPPHRPGAPERPPPVAGCRAHGGDAARGNGGPAGLNGALAAVVHGPAGYGVVPGPASLDNRGRTRHPGENTP